MALMWKVLGDFDRDGSFAYDITPYVNKVSFQNGARKAYQLVADETVMDLDVVNTDGRFNPENASSPYYGKLTGHRRIKFVAVRGSGDESMCVAWIADIDPDNSPAGVATGKTTARLHCVGAKMLLDLVTVDLSMYEDVTGDVVVEDVLQRAIIPPAVGGVWLAGKVGFSEAGLTTYVGTAAAYSDIETGLTVFPTFGDGGYSGYGAIKDVTEAERGRFFFNRAGKAVWRNRHWLQLIVTSSGTVASTGSYKYIDVDYRYEASDIKNSIRVKANPRNNTGSITLWSLESDMTIYPNTADPLVFEVDLRDADGKFVGASSVSYSGETFSSGTASITVLAKGNKAQITITNSGSANAVLTALNITGVGIQDRNGMTAIEEDLTSIANYARREMSLNLKALNGFNDAQNIALYELRRRKDMRGIVTSISFRAAANDSANAHLLDWQIGTRITITLPNGHSADYFIVGENHNVVFPGANSIHECTFYLESAANSSLYWQAGRVGQSEAGSTTRVIY